MVVRPSATAPDLFGRTLTTREELVVANMTGLVTGIMRFLLLRHRVYRPNPSGLTVNA